MNKEIYISQLNSDEKEILYMIDHIDNINNYAKNQHMLIRYTNNICSKCNNNTSSHKHSYCYNCIINTKNWLNILNTYYNIIQNN